MFFHFWLPQGYLPEEVLWRQKEQFSDGVGYNWIDSIKARAASMVTDEQLENAKFRFPHNTPPTKEAYYIRMTFESFFPQKVCECVLCVFCFSIVRTISWVSFTHFRDT